MDDQIDRILAQRQRLIAGHGRRAGIVIAVALHLTLAVVALLASGDREPQRLEIVAVNIVPLQALGARQPRRPAPRPAPVQPALPEPEPARPESAKPEPEPEPKPMLPNPQPQQPEPRRPAPQTPQPAKPDPPNNDPDPGSASSGPAQREGSPRGSAFGSSSFGAEVAGIDSDFKHDYYVNRMLAMIHAQWQRPAVGEIRAVLQYNILRSGEITEIELVESSGNNGFDLAALRAVRNASPLLPLPASYRKDNLTVTLIVR